MLSGRRVFEGATISDTLVAVLKEEPDWSRVAVKARKLLQRCLNKDPKMRLRDIGNAWALLDEGTEASAAKIGLQWKAAAGVMALALAAALWALLHATRVQTTLQPLVRLDSISVMTCRSGPA